MCKETKELFVFTDVKTKEEEEIREEEEAEEGKC